MKQRVITAAIALVLFIPIIWIGGITIEFVAALLAVVGVYELFRMKGLTLLSFEGILSAIGAVILVLPKERWFFFLPEKTSTFMLFYLIVMILLGTSVISKNTLGIYNEIPTQGSCKFAHTRTLWTCFLSISCFLTAWTDASTAA